MVWNTCKHKPVALIASAQEPLTIDFGNGKSIVLHQPLSRSQGDAFCQRLYTLLFGMKPAGFTVEDVKAVQVSSLDLDGLRYCLRLGQVLDVVETYFCDRGEDVFCVGDILYLRR